jgi:hypothetical protein
MKAMKYKEVFASAVPKGEHLSKSVRVYRCVEEHECGKCNRQIRVGELITRIKVKERERLDRKTKRVAVESASGCRDCVPFVILNFDDKVPEQEEPYIFHSKDEYCKEVSKHLGRRSEF